MSLAERADLTARLSLKDEFSGKLRGVQGAMGRFDRATSNTQKSLGKFGQNLSRAATIGATAFAGAIVGSIKIAGDFEAQLNTINTIARANAEDLGAIGDAIRKVARDTGTPLEELTQGYYDLLSAGIKAKDSTNVLNAANRLAIGGLASTAETVDLLTSAINTYGGDATKAAGYADVFAKAVERGKVTAAEIAGSFSNVGSIAASSGIEIEEIAAAFARLTAAGVPAAEAATQMRSALVALTKRTPELEGLEAATKKNYLAIAGKKGLVAALEEMRIDAKKAGIPLIELLGRVEGLNFTLLTTGGNFDAYNADLLAMADASGTAGEQMAERQKGLNFQLGRLKALAKDAGITIGSALLPKLVPLIEKLNEFIGLNQDKIAGFGQGLADFVGQIDWTGIGNSLQLAGLGAKAVLDVFMGMPDWIKTAVLTGWGLNKVTGGLVVSLAKDTFGQFFGRGSSPANPMWVTSATGGAGGVGAGAGVGGRGAGLLGGVARAAGLGIGVGTVMSSNAANGNGTLNDLGFLGNIGGGALAGASVAGPLGALAGGLLGIGKSVTEMESAMNTNMARQAHSNLGSTQGIATSDLLVKLSAIDTGINQINSNPLNVLVSGDALSELQQMREQVVAAIEANSEASRANLQPLPEKITAKQKAKFDTLRDKLEANRIATVTSKTAIVAGGNSDRNAIVSAIRSNRPILNVRVNVSNSVRTTVYRTGTTINRTSTGVRGALLGA